MLKDNTDDGWGGLSMVEEVRVLKASAELCLDGNPDEIIAEEDLPFMRYQPAPEEEKLEDIQTGMFIFESPAVSCDGMVIKIQ